MFQTCSVTLNSTGIMISLELFLYKALQMDIVSYTYPLSSQNVDNNLFLMNVDNLQSMLQALGIKESEQQREQQYYRKH